MAERVKETGKLPYRTDKVYRVVDPEDVTVPSTDPLRLLSEANGASGQLRAYMDANDTNLAGDYSASATVLLVDDVGGFAADDDVEIELDAVGTFHEDVVASVDPDASTITITTGLPGAASTGRRVRKLLADIAMVEYGTPAVADETWGWLGVLPDTLDVKIGNLVAVEAVFKGSPTGGLDRRFGVLERVADPRENV